MTVSKDRKNNAVSLTSTGINPESNSFVLTVNTDTVSSFITKTLTNTTKLQSRRHRVTHNILTFYRQAEEVARKKNYHTNNTR